jgi:signal transduction histidine kinase
LRFAPEKSSVEVGARLDHQGMVEVAVRDHGPGIEKTELEKIFDRFQQVDRGSADDTAGTGLGLAICREIVTLHGGRIWGVSRVGRGSTFYFTLKIHTAVEGPEEDVDESPPKRVGDLPPLKTKVTKEEPRPKARRSLPPIQA